MKKVLRGAAALLAAGMLLPLASCGKSKKTNSVSSGKREKSDVVLETDPYFSTETKVLEIPVDPDKKVENTSIIGYKFVGQKVKIDYSVSYEVPKGVDYFEHYDEYYKQGQLVFDLSGELISDAQAESSMDYQIASSMDADGNMYALVQRINEDFSTKYSVEKVDGKKSETLFEIPANSGDWVDEAFIEVIPDKVVFISINGQITGYSPKGEKLYDVDDIGRNVSPGIFQEDGKYYLLTSYAGSIDDGLDLQFKEIDLKTGMLGTGLNGDAIEFHSYTITPDGIFVPYNSKILKYEIKTNSFTESFDWNDTDMDLSLISLGSVLPINQDECYAIYENIVDYMAVSVSLTHVKREEKNPHAGKKIITVGCSYLPDPFLSFVSKYNSDMSKKTRITILDYTTEMLLEGEDAYSSKKTDRVRLDILGGQGPDVLLGFEHASSLLNENLLLDLNPLIDGPDGLDRSLYYDNVFHACEKDGKMFFVPLTVYVDVLAVNDKIIPKTDGWTYEEFLKTGKSVPSDITFYQTRMKPALLSRLYYASQGEFIDYSSKTVHFDNPDFYTMLEIARSFGVDKVPEDEYEEARYEDGMVYVDQCAVRPEDKFSEEILATLEAMFGSFGTYYEYASLLKEGMSFRGYPGKDGGGIFGEFYNSLSIPASSKNQSEAWEVIKGFLSEEAQMILGDQYGFPVLKEACHKCMKLDAEDMRANAQKLMQEGYAPEIEAEFAHFLDITDQDITDCENIILQIDRTNFGDDAIDEIICEEALAYFSGSRTAEDISKIINNRATTVVRER